jgi:two-component system, chemotaxis family, chemotaxis protein CheY
MMHNITLARLIAGSDLDRARATARTSPTRITGVIAMSDPLRLLSLSVHLVEPSGVQAKIIAGQLGNLNISNVRVFGSGGASLAAMTESPPDLVISALYLPDMTGTELVTAMRNDPALEGVAFILISSETRPQALEAVRQSGVCGILPKPFSPEQLDTALTTTLCYLQNDDDSAGDFDAEGVRVLLVDDSSISRKFMRRILENLGIEQFSEAANGRQAVDLLSHTSFDLVVTDYNMPEMDGGALVDYIRKQSWQQSVPVLMVTSEADEGRLAAVEEAGVSGICDKPFEPAMLKRLLSRILPSR